MIWERTKINKWESTGVRNISWPWFYCNKRTFCLWDKTIKNTCGKHCANTFREYIWQQREVSVKDTSGLRKNAQSAGCSSGNRYDDTYSNRQTGDWNKREPGSDLSKAQDYILPESRKWMIISDTSGQDRKEQNISAKSGQSLKTIHNTGIKDVFIFIRNCTGCLLRRGGRRQTTADTIFVYNKPKEQHTYHIGRENTDKD